ncbi:hypothetical protein NQ317_017783 [Molorchus minor]|uniref:Uncharacterized protein n=1 Tax=Molorchus minor TaxID=1323400 RepID=A0ABQ9K183_9CUCU|nr:hypothetical protein NQ317_017783 [Molorchus minor]
MANNIALDEPTNEKFIVSGAVNRDVVKLPDRPPQEARAFRDVDKWRLSSQGLPQAVYGFPVHLVISLSLILENYPYLIFKVTRLDVLSGPNFLPWTTFSSFQIKTSENNNLNNY